jgi:CheY-like chemotaxis protein
VRDLHRALLDLYDPGELARSRLLELFSIGERPDPPAALRRLLLEAVDALKPPDNLPQQSKAWRTYRILLHRYVQQVAQREIAASLGFSVRQLQRHEQVALQTLADYLYARHGLEFKAPAPVKPQRAASSARAGAASQEMQRLRTSFGSEAMSIADLTRSALKTAAPLLEAEEIAVTTSLPDNLPRLAVQTIPMRQALVSILTVAGHHAPKGQVVISALAEPAQVRVVIRSQPGCSSSRVMRAEDSENLGMARELVALSGGSLELAESGSEGSFTATLLLPAAQQLGVLVIDDNVDALQLCQRYLEGTRYNFVGVRDPEQALELARELTPKVIVLDVMLPGMDGWELLGRLREHPATHRVPVIVSTILPHEKLALTLGAAAFLRKPVSREALLEALDAQLTQRS